MCTLLKEYFIFCVVFSTKMVTSSHSNTNYIQNINAILSFLFFCEAEMEVSVNLSEWAPWGLFSQHSFLSPIINLLFICTFENGSSLSPFSFLILFSSLQLDLSPWLLFARWPLTVEQWQLHQMSCGCVSGALTTLIHDDIFFFFVLLNLPPFSFRVSIHLCQVVCLC